MSENKRISRREFLKFTALASGALVVAGCAPATLAPTSAPTAAPKATDAPKPTDAPKATDSPKPTAAATTAPTAAPKATEAPKLGKNLIGKLEGPEVVLDAAKAPKKFSEAPALADLVKAGKLPKVEERLPQDVLVFKPQSEIGKFGGTWKGGFTGPGDLYNGKRLAAHDHILFFDYKVAVVVPNVALSWEVTDGGKTTILHLRKGLKWSDGSLVTADDFVFWYEDMYLNKELTASPSSLFAIQGKQGKLEKVDDLTVKYTFPEPYYLFPEMLAGFNVITSHANFGNAAGGGFAPSKYLKAFHSKYTAKDELDKKMAAEKFDTWPKLFLNKNTWGLNPDLPTVTPWKTVQPANTPTWTLERNPYFYGVDTEGNQLPYVDKISLSLAESVEVVNLRAIAGEYDFQSRHIDLAKLPVFLENQAKGNYKVYLDPGEFGSNSSINMVQSYDADPEIAKWITNADFRRAFSMGINRDQINEAFYLGLGTPGTVAPSDINPYFPGAEYRTKYAALDVKAANDLLDKIGLDKKDAQGFRLRSDGKRLTLNINCVAGIGQYTTIAEMIKGQVAKIGLEINPKEIERSLHTTQIQANEVAAFMWDNGGTERPFGDTSNLFGWMGDPYRTWLSNNGVAPKPAAGATPVPFKEPSAVIKQIWADWQKGFAVPEADRINLGKGIWKSMIDNAFQIGLVGQSPATLGVRIVKNTMANIPGRMLVTTDSMTPGQTHPETYYFK